MKSVSVVIFYLMIGIGSPVYAEDYIEKFRNLPIDSLLQRLCIGIYIVAESNLREQGDFTPFAALASKDEKRLILRNPETSKRNAEENFAFLEERLSDKADSCSAMAICSQAEIQLKDGKTKVTCIYAVMEKESGEAKKVYIPFKKIVSGEYHFDDPIVMSAAPFF